MAVALSAPHAVMVAGALGGSGPGRRHQSGRVKAMAELGVDSQPEVPKPLNDEFVRAADVVITMGCGDACPIYPGTRYEDWEVDDPAGQSLERSAPSATPLTVASGRSSPSSRPS